MKHNKIKIAAISLLISSLLLTRADAQNQTQLRVVADTGLITLGPNQILRISGDGVDQDDAVTFRFRRIGYQAVSEASGITKYSISSNALTSPILLTGTEAVTLSVQGNQIGTDATRVIVMSNRPNVRVNASIIDSVTGNVVACTDLVIDVSWYTSRN